MVSSHTCIIVSCTFLKLKAYLLHFGCFARILSMRLFCLFSGCGRLWVTDGIWKTQFAHCMFAVEVSVIIAQIEEKNASLILRNYQRKKAIIKLCFQLP